LLSSLGRVFTKFLQMYGFTCGLEDFLLSPKVEAERLRILSLATERSAAAAKVCFLCFLVLCFFKIGVKKTDFSRGMWSF
jgi:hypothetical protein